MHVGFYLESCGGTPQNTEIYTALNNAIDNGEIKDASVFFNRVGFIPTSNKFGMFNSADLWSFTGLLISTSIDNVIRALNIVNKFHLAYLYDPSEGKGKELFSLINISRLVPILAKNEEDFNEIHRLTGRKPFLLNNFSIQDILEVCNE